MSRKGGNPDILEVSKKSTGQKTPLGKAKYVTALQSKGSDGADGAIANRRENLLNESMLFAGINPKDKRVPILRQLFGSWMSNKTMGELQSLIEMENLLKVVKTSRWEEICKKLLEKKPLDNDDWEAIRFMRDTAEKLHKLRHGTKTEVRTVDFKDVLSLYEKKKKKIAMEQDGSS